VEPVGCLVPFLTIEFDEVQGGVAGAVVVEGKETSFDVQDAHGVALCINGQ